MISILLHSRISHSSRLVTLINPMPIHSTLLPITLIIHTRLKCSNCKSTHTLLSLSHYTTQHVSRMIKKINQTDIPFSNHIQSINHNQPTLDSQTTLTPTTLTPITLDPITQTHNTTLPLITHQSLADLHNHLSLQSNITIPNVYQSHPETCIEMDTRCIGEVMELYDGCESGVCLGVM